MNGDSSPIVAALYAIAAKIGPTTLFQTPTELTISSGEVTATRNFHTIDTEADAASDNLDTIAGGSVGRILLIRAENDARTVVIKHSTGNIWLKEKVDLSLDDIRDGILLIYDGTKWIDLGGAINLGTAVLKSLFDANTILAADTDNTPAALTVAQQRLVGRITAGNITALTAAQVRTLINVEDGATADQTEADILTLLGLTSVEVDQLENIGSNVVTAAIWGYVAGLTTHPIGGDGTAGRVLREIKIVIANGTQANTLKCTVSSLWNGDTIAETNNIAKGATTGDFSLDANGKVLTIEASGLTGNVVAVYANIYSNASGTILTVYNAAVANDIFIKTYHASTGVAQDLTVLVDTGIIYIDSLYITEA